MKNPEDFNDILPNTIDGQERKASESQFPSLGHAARASLLRKLDKGTDPLVNTQDNIACGRGRVVVTDVVTDSCKIPPRQAPSNECALPGIPAVNEFAHFIVLDERIHFRSGQAFFDFLNEPLVVVHEAFKHFLHQRVRVAALFGSEASKLGFEIGRKVYFHAFQS